MASKNGKNGKRGELAAAHAIGKSFRIRTGPRTTVNGVISACELLKAKNAAGKPQYQVTMICGSAQVERTFTVTKLP